MVIGVPLKLLHESQGLTVTVELKSGQLYRGRLHEVEDSMNMQMRDVTVTARDGKLSQMEHCFIRGSSVRLVVVPDNLQHAPFFKTLMALAAKLKNSSSRAGAKKKSVGAGGMRKPSRAVQTSAPNASRNAK